MAFKPTVICFALICGSLAAFLPKRDTTITVPHGVTYHPASQNICTPTKWTDVVTFFVGNYFSHAATVVKFPGEPLHITIINMIMVILFPCMGAGRGLFAITRHAALQKDPLQQALHAQALCMVVRAEGWKPKAGEFVRSLALRPNKVPGLAGNDPDQYWRIGMSEKEHPRHVRHLQNNIVTAHSDDLVDKYMKYCKNYTGPFRILTRTPPWLMMNFEWTTKHIIVAKKYKTSGDCELPEGYELAYIPANALIEHTLPMGRLRRTILSSYDLASGIIAIVQIFFACSTLYQSRGYQISVYGYSAFGFTVLPYLFMSFANLVGNLATPSYSKLYLVHTEIMDEAIQRGGKFTDVVGKMESESLRVEDLMVFSGSFQTHRGDLWCQLGENVYADGTTEPILKGSLQLAQTLNNAGTEGESQGSTNTESGVSVKSPHPAASPDEENIDAEKQTETGQKEEGKEVPVLICPSCYSFRTVYKNTSSTSIKYRNRHFVPRSAVFSAAVWFIASLPLIPIGVLSNFHAGDSTLAQRVWIMAWYAVGIVSVSNPFFSDFIVERGVWDSVRTIRSLKKNRSGGVGTRIWHLVSMATSLAVFVLVFVTPAIGRFAVVGKMLMDYGSCTSLG